MLSYLVTRFRALKSEEGQDLAEYALLIALIAVTLVLVIGAVANGLGNTFNSVRASLQTAQSNPIQP